MSGWARCLAEGFFELLFPPLCVVCHAPAPRHLCDNCAGGIKRMNPPLCDRCGCVLDDLRADLQSASSRKVFCRRCRTLHREFTLCRAYGPYEGPLRTAIQALKYRGKTAVVPALADLLAQALEEEPLLRQAQIVAPVPLHRRRQRQRGFNQSELLARALAQRTGLDLRCDLLARVRATPPQVGLSAAQRLENLQGAFAAREERVPADRILLLDDVVTTGATFDACAHALRAASAKEVYALALAHD